MTLGETFDSNFQQLKSRYGLSSKELVEKLETRETKQATKPLQVFPNPTTGDLGEFSEAPMISIEFPEFTSLCPKTGQPDFAKFELHYQPEEVCVEMKSLKLYLNSYRNEGHFYEEVSNLIYWDLLAVLKPGYLELLMHFNARGGMPVTISRIWNKDGEI